MFAPLLFVTAEITPLLILFLLDLTRFSRLKVSIIITDGTSQNLITTVLKRGR